MMADQKSPKPTKRQIAIFVLLMPVVVFREEIEAVLAILLVVIALAIAIGAWHYFPEVWYWIAIPGIVVLAGIGWPLLKFADRLEARFDHEMAPSKQDQK